MSSFMIQSLLKSHVSKSIVSAPPLEVPDEMLVSSTSDQGIFPEGLISPDKHVQLLENYKSTLQNGTLQNSPSHFLTTSLSNSNSPSSLRYSSPPRSNSFSEPPNSSSSPHFVSPLLQQQGSGSPLSPHSPPATTTAMTSQNVMTSHNIKSMTSQNMSPLQQQQQQQGNQDNPEQKPTHSYVAIIAMAILESSCKKLVLSDIYKYILDKYPYFKNKGQGWRNSVRHNLSLNRCFAKAGRAENGKGNYWTIHPANMEDFRKGDFRRRLTRRSRRKYLSVNDLSQLNPLLSSVSLLKQENSGTDELLTALFKYNLSNLVANKNTTSQSSNNTSPPPNFSSLMGSSIPSKSPDSINTMAAKTLSNMNLSSSSQCLMSTLPQNNNTNNLLSSLAQSALQTPKNIPTFPPSSSGTTTFISDAGATIEEIPTNLSPTTLSSILNQNLSVLQATPKGDYISNLLLNTPTTPQTGGSLTTVSSYSSYPSSFPAQASQQQQQLAASIKSLQLPAAAAVSLSANNILTSRILASQAMRQWITYCEKMLNVKEP